MTQLTQIITDKCNEWEPDFSVLTYKYFLLNVSTLPTSDADIYIDPNGVKYSISGKPIRQYYNKDFLWIYNKFLIPSSQTENVNNMSGKIVIGPKTKWVKFIGSSYVSDYLLMYNGLNFTDVFTEVDGIYTKI